MPQQQQPEREPLRVTAKVYHDQRDLLLKVAEIDRRVVEIVNGHSGQVRARLVPA